MAKKDILSIFHFSVFLSNRKNAKMELSCGHGSGLSKWVPSDSSDVTKGTNRSFSLSRNKKINRKTFSR